MHDIADRHVLGLERQADHGSIDSETFQGDAERPRHRRSEQDEADAFGKPRIHMLIACGALFISAHRLPQCLPRGSLLTAS
jgi:hypothetical protein